LAQQPTKRPSDKNKGPEEKPLGKISIIIPTYNEQDNIEKLIKYLFDYAPKGHLEEIILVDGWSQDNTMFLAQRLGARVFKLEKHRRSRQMNKGAHEAKGDILYFLHADSFPPKNFTTDILNTLDSGYAAGCFRLTFDHQHWILKMISWFTRFNVNSFRFGDQSLFIKKDIFEFTGGFDDSLTLMEDQDMVIKIQKYGDFKVQKNKIVTSARKFVENGPVKLFWTFFYLYVCYKFGMSQDNLVEKYNKMIKQSKIKLPGG